MVTIASFIVGACRSGRVGPSTRGPHTSNSNRGRSGLFPSFFPWSIDVPVDVAATASTGRSAASWMPALGLPTRRWIATPIALPLGGLALHQHFSKREVVPSTRSPARERNAGGPSAIAANQATLGNALAGGASGFHSHLDAPHVKNRKGCMPTPFSDAWEYLS